jgi:benzil reductase ((S)-benzoin forming)
MYFLKNLTDLLYLDKLIINDHNGGFFMNYVIVTGSSKGLGEAIAKQLVTQNNMTLLCIARTNNNELKQLAKKNNTPFHFFPFDLANIDDIEQLMQNIFSTIQIENSHSIHLINNAGVLPPIKPIDQTEPNEIVHNLHINLLSPMIITLEFIKHTKDLSCDKRIINVSSGAGKRPIYGWSCYGTSKAGLDLFSQNVATDQIYTRHPIQICSFGPGIMDTAMQEQIRSTDEENFKDVEAFRTYKKEGKLLLPETVAKVIVNLLTKTDFPHGKVVSVQDFL